MLGTVGIIPSVCCANLHSIAMRFGAPGCIQIGTCPIRLGRGLCFVKKKGLECTEAHGSLWSMLLTRWVKFKCFVWHLFHQYWKPKCLKTICWNVRQKYVQKNNHNQNDKLDIYVFLKTTEKEEGTENILWVFLSLVDSSLRGWDVFGFYRAFWSWKEGKKEG